MSTLAEEHAHWITQTVLTSSELFLAVLAVGAASLLAMTERRTSSPPDAEDVEDCGEVISMHDAVTFKIDAVKILRSAINNDEVLDSGILIYSIMCLMVTEVLSSQ